MTVLPERIEANIMPEPNSGCWLWLAYVTPLGYGRVKYQKKTCEAYRVVYEIIKGPVPEGLVLDHKCRVPGCVNPDHLEPVTHAENMRRARHVTCLRGHEFNEQNTHWYKGQRFCRSCGVIHSRNYQKRKQK